MMHDMCAWLEYRYSYSYEYQYWYPYHEGLVYFNS